MNTGYQTTTHPSSDHPYNEPSDHIYMEIGDAEYDYAHSTDGYVSRSVRTHPEHYGRSHTHINDSVERQNQYDTVSTRYDSVGPYNFYTHNKRSGTRYQSSYM